MSCVFVWCFGCYCLPCEMARTIVVRIPGRLTYLERIDRESHFRNGHDICHLYLYINVSINPCIKVTQNAQCTKPSRYQPLSRRWLTFSFSFSSPVTIFSNSTISKLQQVHWSILPSIGYELQVRRMMHARSYACTDHIMAVLSFQWIHTPRCHTKPEGSSQHSSVKLTNLCGRVLSNWYIYKYMHRIIFISLQWWWREVISDILHRISCVVYVPYCTESM